ncbi:regulatory protein, luxR family [Flavobacterium fluvii]|uniref:Regulatory protein, luxR family n=1 Tax=Flavobacterium fluvii TaxID=468056 RepID=A0A1M5KDL5_9FLAO|nr:helix-turn-helix transcriptional regulator [Flavobacterium fluvii]SHG51034.1 regulatory protein, luxR family [Flavobacterium fluvii]
MDKEINVLSKSELKVLTLICNGYTSETIGLKLGITKSTVQTHRRNMLRKTGFKNTQQLVGWAVREGFLK